MDIININCPACKQEYFVFQKDLKCKIFRCGYIKLKNNKIKQLAPHCKQTTIDKYIKNKQLISGCGKPFKYSDNKTIICDYI